MKKIMVSVMLLGLLIMVACSNDDETVKGQAEIDSKYVGTWNGAIEVPEAPLNIVIEFSAEDTFKGNISIPLQNLKEFSLSAIQAEEETIYFEMNLPGQEISFDGELVDEDRIEGTFTQQGQSFPFYLDRGQLSDEVTNPEEPINFVSVQTEHGELKGELLLPEGEGPFPVALIIPGSGPTDRNGNSETLPGQNNSLKMLAEGLAKEGIASVRYSKRGAGENKDATIPEKDIRFNDFVNDAASWIQLLNSDDRFSEVSVIGHSQGSLVGMLAIQQSTAEQFVSIAGAGKPIHNVLLEQLSSQLTEEQLKIAEDIINQLKEGKTVKEVPAFLQSVFRDSVQPFLSSWMAYDPSQVIKDLDLPILIVQGTSDIQVNENHAEFLLNAQPNAQKLIIENMNHVLKESASDPTNQMKTYTDPDLPLASGLVEGIANFIHEK